MFVMSSNSVCTCLSKLMFILMYPSNLDNLQLCLLSFVQIWDRRAKFVAREEMEKWNDICPTMMSDEETLDSKSLKRRRPEWRSSEFNDLMDELDKRYEDQSKHPRKGANCGDPTKECCTYSC